MLDPKRPYNDLPPLPPKADVETRAILKKCVTARTALAELRLAGHLIPDQSVLVHAIPNLEAKDSSAIENIVTTNDALFREASLGDHEADASNQRGRALPQCALRRRRCAQDASAFHADRRRVCRAITGIDLDVRRTPGTTLTNSHTGEVIYTPPEGETRLREMLANWETFRARKSGYGSSGADGDPPLPVRSHPSVSGRQRPYGAHPEYSGSDPGWTAGLPTLYLSRYILEHPRRLLSPARTSHLAPGMGTLDSLHACRRRGDIGVDNAEDQSRSSAHG